MLDQPLVSIICSCYNHQNYIIRTLNSVVQQTYFKTELIIVDDYSEDNSVLKIETWLINNPNVHFIKNEKNLGLPKSFNNAIKKAKGDYFIDLSGDDILNPNCIETQVQHLNKNSAFVYANGIFIDKDDNFQKIIFDKNLTKKINLSIVDGTFYEHLIRKTGFINCISALYSRKVFDDLGGYDEDLNFEDFDYWLRASKNYDVQFIDDVLIKKRVLENSLGSNFFKKGRHTKRLNESIYIILNKASYNSNNNTENLALIYRAIKQSKWAVRTLNIKHIYLYISLLSKLIFILVIKKFSKS